MSDKKMNNNNNNNNNNSNNNNSDHPTDTPMQLPPAEAMFASQPHPSTHQLNNNIIPNLTPQPQLAPVQPLTNLNSIPGPIVTPVTNNPTTINSPVSLNSNSGPPTAQQITQLIEDLRNNDIQTRLNAFKQITTISNALGPDRTRNELVPYLNEFVDDDDEILVELAIELGLLTESVGGNNYLYVLLQPLEHLCGVEESSVRDRAVESIIKISDKMNDKHIGEYIYTLIERLGRAEWFTSRISCCSLFTGSIYNRCSQDQQRELRKLFIKLSMDDTPMVKRAACNNLGKFVNILDYESVKNELFNAFTRLAKDDQDSVRLLTVSASVCFASKFQQFKPSDNVIKMRPIIFGLCGDKSWRVRYMVADKFVDICNSIGSAETKSDELVDGFVRLLQDDEPEVRTAACFKVGEVCKLVGALHTVKKILPPLKILVRDQSQYVRAALASTIMTISTVIKKEDTIEHLVALFLILLKDSNSEVRLNIISKLESINQVMSVDQLAANLLPAISELATDNKWRVRLQIIQHIPTLAKQLGPEFFNAKLSSLCMDWLGDQVYSIREAATTNLTKLAQVFGVEWAKLNIIPKVINLGSNKSYLYRMTAVHAIKDIAVVLGQNSTVEYLLPVLIKLCNDQVPNVRFNCIRTISDLLQQNLLGSRQNLLKSNPTLLALINKLTQGNYLLA